MNGLGVSGLGHAAAPHAGDHVATDLGQGRAAAPRAVTPLLSRADLLTLARAGKPWAFIPRGLDFARAHPADATIRLLVAAAMLKLRLKTPALALLDSIAPPADMDPAIAQLRRAADATAETLIDADERIARARANLSVLLRREGEGDMRIRVRAAEHAFDAWAQRSRTIAAYRTTDGSVVTRPQAAGADDPFASFIEQPSLPEGTPVLPVSPDASSAASNATGMKALYVDGFDTPIVVLRAHEQLTRNPDGSWPLIAVVHGDACAFLDALAHLSLEPMLAADRFACFVGNDAPALFREFLIGRIDLQLGGHVLAAGGPAHAGVIEPVLRDVLGQQERELVRLREAVAAAYVGRNAAYWRERFAGVLTGSSTAAEPLRVLIPTCRFSTFIKHSSADLARTLERLGHQARVLIEPDDSSQLSVLAHARACAEFRPDLVVLINYPRTSVPGLSANVPFVCWVQDAMPHLFDPRVGATQTGLDFVMGHLHTEFFTQYGYTRQRTLSSWCVASDEKFAPDAIRPVSPERRARLSVDVAFVTNHSETPEQMRERLIRNAATGPERDMLTPMVQAACEMALQQARVSLASGATYPHAIDRVARAPDDCGPGAALWPETIARNAVLAATGREPEQHWVTMLTHQIIRPLMDRAIRHESAHWAASICDRRGWSFRLYGKGWETHPTLARFAGGTLDHGEDLRASYALAGVQLHATGGSAYHQRVVECALAGGLPLTRRKYTDAMLAMAYMEARACDTGEPVACDLVRKWEWVRIADDWRMMALAAGLQRNGISVPDLFPRLPELRQQPWIRYHSHEPDFRENFIAGDLFETGFCTEQELESRLELALARGPWREQMTRTIRERALAFYTHTALVRGMLAMVAGGCSDR